jgi:outer membrane lipoprotein-sorting protein
MTKFKRLYACLAVLLVILSGCGGEQPPDPAPVAEEEALARTEFTARVENFFEYAPLKANKPSFFRIHLTDLLDGTPVEKAEVTLIARPAGSSQPAAETTAKVGKVTGIYVADLTIQQPGTYDIEFHIKNAKLDERFPLSDFKVE